MGNYYARAGTAAILAALLTAPVDLQSQTNGIRTAAELKAMELEEVLDVRVFSASRKAELASEIAAAIAVLTAEDVRRSGAASIPDALRYVPGLRLPASTIVSVSAQGFTTNSANKLQVLIPPEFF